MDAKPPAAPWLHRSLVVAKSRLEGRGLFAQESLAADTVLWRLGGRVVTRAEFAQILAEAEASTDAPYVDAITLDGDHDLVLPPNTAVHFANHSCDPNAWWLDAVTATARRAIVAGEEVTTDYATSTDHSDFAMRCACRAESCRGIVTGDDWRLPELQVRYAGHWIPWLERRIAAGQRGE